MTILVYDIEANSLLYDIHTVHCISIQEIALDGSRKPVESFSDTKIPGVQGTLQEALQRLSEASELVAHNQINFDLPALKKLYNWEPNEETTKVFDTLVVSRLLNPDRPKPFGFTGKGGPHSLEAWGYRTGKTKPSHEDWSVFSSSMLRRNREDVEINSSVYFVLRAELEDHDWSGALEIEHQVAKIMTQQETNGVKFDINGAVNLCSTLSTLIEDIDTDLLSRVPAKIKAVGATVAKPFKANGERSKRVLDWFSDGDGALAVAGPFTKIAYEPINLNSQTQLKEFLLSEGWEPDEWNYDDAGNKSSPKLTESSFHTINGEAGKLIKDRTLYSHRLNQVQGWIDRVRSDGRIAATANTCGTNTGRFRHSNVVNVPKAAEHIPFGREMRSLFTVEEGNYLVGHDAEGLELRMLAHYMNDPSFTEAVVNGDKKLGTDIHTVNQRLAELPTRDHAKTFIYAFIYGAGDEKLGSIVGGGKSEGSALRRRFLENLPALDKLIKRVKRASKKGWLRGIDGRKIWMRSVDGRVMEHKALNTLLQSAGAVVMKKSMCILDSSIQNKDWIGNYQKVLDMHDEAQAEIKKDHVLEYMELAKQSIVKAGEHFKLKVPLAADAAYGSNWAETH